MNTDMMHPKLKALKDALEDLGFAPQEEYKGGGLRVCLDPLIGPSAGFVSFTACRRQGNSPDVFRTLTVGMDIRYPDEWLQRQFILKDDE